MGKRVTVAVLLVALSLICSVLVFCCTEKSGYMLIECLEDAERMHYGGLDPADRITEAERLWEKKEALFRVVLKRSESDMLECCFTDIKRYRKAGNDEKLFDAVGDCITELYVLLYGERPYLENIF